MNFAGSGAGQPVYFRLKALMRLMNSTCPVAESHVAAGILLLRCRALDGPDFQFVTRGDDVQLPVGVAHPLRSAGREIPVVKELGVLAPEQFHFGRTLDRTDLASEVKPVAGTQIVRLVGDRIVVRAWLHRVGEVVIHAVAVGVGRFGRIVERVVGLAVVLPDVRGAPVNAVHSDALARRASSAE